MTPTPTELVATPTPVPPTATPIPPTPTPTAAPEQDSEWTHVTNLHGGVNEFLRKRLLGNI